MKSHDGLATKAVRRAKQILSRYVPYNTAYKPIGVKSMASGEGFSVKYLRNKYTSTLSFPDKFLKDCSPFAKPIMSLDLPGDFIVTLKNGRIYSTDPSNMAVISEENYLIDEISFQWTPDQGEKLLTGKDNAIFKKKGLKKPMKYKGTVFSLLGGGGAKSYYYHWMMDSIAKLGLLKEAGHFSSVDYFLVPAYSARYHKEYLDYFGISKDKVIVENPEFHIQADCLMVSSYVQIEFHHPKWACDFLYQSFIKQEEKEKPKKLIYIPRGDAPVNRKVLNEPELIAALKKYGFEVHNLADMSVPEEAKYLNSAALVVGIQGSGFANLVYCEPGTKVLEIFPETYVRHIDYDLCNKKNLEFHYLICPSDAVAIDCVDGQKINVIADVPAIISKIEALIGIANETVKSFIELS
jgi:hypothetical protein